MPFCAGHPGHSAASLSIFWDILAQALFDFNGFVLEHVFLVTSDFKRFIFMLKKLKESRLKTNTSRVLVGPF